MVIALPTLTNQSPEEGILGRLEELGIQIGSCPNSASTSMLLETSMESTASSTTDPLGAFVFLRDFRRLSF